MASPEGVKPRFLFPDGKGNLVENLGKSGPAKLNSSGNPIAGITTTAIKKVAPMAPETQAAVEEVVTEPAHVTAVEVAEPTLTEAVTILASLSGSEGGLTLREYELVVTDLENMGNLTETYEDDGSTIQSAVNKLYALKEASNISTEHFNLIVTDMKSVKIEK